MKYKTVIFDFDGTLADTSPSILGSISFTQEMMGLPEISLEQMYSHIGPPMEESYNRNFGLTGDDLKKAVQFHKQYAVEQGYKKIKFYNGILELVDKLQASDINTAIATLKEHSTAVKILEYFNVAKKFNVVIGENPGSKMTKSQLLNYCAEKTDTDKKDCVLIGDSKYDAIGAYESGMDFIGVLYGFGFKTTEEINQFPNVGIATDVISLSNLLLKK